MLAKNMAFGQNFKPKSRAVPILHCRITAVSPRVADNDNTCFAREYRLTKLIQLAGLA